MDERRRLVIFQRRMQIQRICVTICTGATLLLFAGLISYFGDQDRHENALLEKERTSQMIRLRTVQERGREVMIFCAVTLIGVIAASGGVLLLCWRCPECHYFFGLEFHPQACPRCRSSFLPPGENGRR